MQVNILAEREVSKVIGLVAEIHEYLGLRGHVGQEVREMQGTTRLEQVADVNAAYKVIQCNAQKVIHPGARCVVSG